MGKYQCGLKKNINWVRTETTDRLVYVNLAIAELEKEEMLRIKWQKEEEAKETRCLVYGIKHELEAVTAPTGEIVSDSKFNEEYKKDFCSRNLDEPQGCFFQIMLNLFTIRNHVQTHSDSFSMGFAVPFIQKYSNTARVGFHKL